MREPQVRAVAACLRALLAGTADPPDRCSPFPSRLAGERDAPVSRVNFQGGS
jgi:hypothetical protein